MKAASITLFLLAACATGPGRGPMDTSGPGSWSIDAEIVESCCCNAICPCLVGSPSTLGYCVGNRLVKIDRGHFGGVNLDGVQLVLTFRVRKWSKLYVDESATHEQVVAVRNLMEKQRGWTYGNILELKRVPLKVERDDTRISYQVPAATTEIELLPGEDGGPIRIQNLPSRFRNYVQYKSKTLVHTAEAEDESFEYSDTNGFCARYSARG